MQEALQSLATDPGLHQMLPRLSTFLYEGVSIGSDMEMYMELKSYMYVIN